MALFGKKKKKEEAAEGAEGEKTEGEKEEGKEKPAEEKKEGDAPAGGEGEARKEGEGGEGGEGADAAADPDAAAKKKKKKKLIIVGAVVLMILLAAGGGAFFTLGGHKEEAAKPAAPAEGEAAKPVFFDMPQILVNLNTGSKGPSFIKATITLELSNQADVPVAQANLPRLLDNYNTFLREMKASDLYGSAGVYRLREEMLLRANTLLAPVKVKDVLFKEMLVQ